MKNITHLFGLVLFYILFSFVKDTTNVYKEKNITKTENEASLIQNDSKLLFERTPIIIIMKKD
jgi:hypothetical protein